MVDPQTAIDMIDYVDSTTQRRPLLGTFLQESPVQNFGRFYKEVFMGHSKDYKSELGQDFDEYYGMRLIEEFGHLKFSQITPRQIERFLMELAKTKTKQGRLFSPVTVRMFYERLNRTFNLANRERSLNVQTIIISELLGHAQPLQGFSHASRITPSYAHATYDAMRRAVDSLEHPPTATDFEAKSSKWQEN